MRKAIITKLFKFEMFFVNDGEAILHDNMDAVYWFLNYHPYISIAIKFINIKTDGPNNLIEINNIGPEF